MAGTRLAVHATFLLEIVLLTVFSLYYATLPPTDLEVGSTIRTDTESFLVDRSGLGLISTNIKDGLDALEELGRSLFSASSLGTANVDALLIAKPMCTVMVSALDEDPGTYQTPRKHHELVGKALDGAVSKVIQPLLDQLSDITQFTIKTQTLVYGQLSSNAKKTNSSKRYVISSKDVRSFWSEHGSTISSSRRLSPRDESSDTCYLDLIVYVPKKGIIPLSIADKGPDGASEAFILPGNRGAVAIANLDLQSIYDDDDESAVISQEEVYAKAILKSTAYLIEYLRNVTGLSMVGAKTDILMREILRIKFEAALAEMRAVSTVIESASRMKVSAENGEKVSSCLENLQNAIDAAKSSDDLTALSAVNTALRMTQRLATDGDMMEQMYFPQDHYLAVFTPLILPLMLPLLLGLVREIKRYKKLSKGERYGDDDDEKTQEPTVDDGDKKTK